MTIASKTNLLRIGFMGLGLGKGLTTDYTNNADGEGLRRIINNENISGISNIEYQVKTDFRNPSYPHYYRPNSSRLAKILFGAAISRDTRMFGNKGLPTKHTKSHESFTRQILLHWRASCVSWATFLHEPSVLSA